MVNRNKQAISVDGAAVDEVDTSAFSQNSTSEKTKF
jgi:hypothetical protein